MTLDRDDRQTRLEWMIDEFQQARRRRLVTANVRSTASQVETDSNEPARSHPLAAAPAGTSAQLPGMHRDTRAPLV